MVREGNIIVAGKNRVHLVGSVPLNNSDEVFELVGTTLKEFCGRYPDGETGERKNWIDYLIDYLIETA